MGQADYQAFDQAATTLTVMSLKMRNRNAEASSGEGQVAKRENS
jgi:hypothetical protein